MSTFELAPLAVRDLEELLDYVRSESGPDRAESVRCDLISAMHKLDRNPGMGHSRRDLTNRPVLFWAVHGWLIVYRPENRPLRVLRVISGWRDVRAELSGGRYPEPA